MENFCNLCGGKVVKGVCSRCGNICDIEAKSEDTAKSVEIQTEDTKEVSKENSYTDDTITVGKWLFNMLLLSIPLVNIAWVIKIITGGSNRTLKNYAIASIVVAIITNLITVTVMYLVK